MWKRLTICGFKGYNQVIERIVPCLDRLQLISTFYYKGEGLMQVAVNILTQDNKEVGLTVFDTETSRITKITDYTGIWGVNNHNELVGYSYIPLYDCVSNKLVSENAYTLVARVRQGFQTNYIVSDGLGRLKLLTKDDVLDLMTRSIFTNITRGNRNVRTIRGKLPIARFSQHLEIKERVEDTVGQMSALSSASIGTLGSNKKCLGYRMRDKRVGIIKLPLIGNSKDCVNEVVCYELGKLFGVDVAEASIETFNQKMCIMSIYNYDFSVERHMSLKEILGSKGFEEKFSLTWLYDNYGQDCVRDFLRMVIFDLLTHQTDRKISNISIYNDRLYSLYDNGRCLFFDENITSVDTLDIMSTFYTNEHGFGYEYIEKMVGPTKCRELINPNVDYSDVSAILERHYNTEEATILSDYIIRAYRMMLQKV